MRSPRSTATVPGTGTGTAAANGTAPGGAPTRDAVDDGTAPQIAAAGETAAGDAATADAATAGGATAGVQGPTAPPEAPTCTY